MNFKIFAELVELKAKTASIFPFIMGMLYSWYHFQQLSVKNMLLFFISMLFFNMAVDILDNYMDYHNATDSHDYKHETNIIGRENLSLPLIKSLIFTFILIASLIGIYLAITTSWIILWLGIFSFMIGIFYSAGPRPLSSLPVGELASGITMGIIIPLICVYLNVYNLTDFNSPLIGQVTLFSLPSAFAIANLMLANNTCDLEEDELNKRYTLVHYLGKARALKLFKLLVLLSFFVATLATYLNIMPWTVYLIWLVFPKIWKNTQRYTKKQVKLETFPLAVQNLAIFVLAQTLFFLIGILITFF